MDPIIHGFAQTTAAVRRAIRDSQECLKAFAKRHGVKQSMVAKWGSRLSLTDLKTRPKQPRSTVLSIEEEAVVAFLRYTRLPLDECFDVLQVTIQNLTRSSVQRCLQRLDILLLREHLTNFLAAPNFGKWLKTLNDSAGQRKRTASRQIRNIKSWGQTSKGGEPA